MGVADGENNRNSAVAPPAGGPPGGTFAPFRYPAFRAIWLANLASNLGATIQSVAAAWLMTELTSSHRLLALVQASSTIPIMLFGVIAGAIADNYDRRIVMLAAQSGMLVMSAALALLTWLGLITPVLLLAFTLAVGIGTALNSPAWQASVRQQVGRADLPQAISLNTIAFNLARSVGPALGGLLISLTGPEVGFTVNALSYLALIVVLLRWRPDHPPRQRQPIHASIMTGLRFCWGSDPVRRVLARGLLFGFGAAGVQGLLPLLVRYRLHGDEVQYGMVLGAFGIGSIVTALWIAQARRRWGSEAVVTCATLAFALAVVPIGFTHSLPVALACLLVAGGGWVATLTTLNVAMQLRSPEAILGRCMAIYQAVTFGGMAIGAYALGLVADLTGTGTAILSAAGLMAGSLPVLRRFAPMPTREEGRVAA
jgi:MFS family permease